MLLLLWVLFGFIFCSASPTGFHIPVSFDEDYEEIEVDDPPENVVAARVEHIHHKEMNKLTKFIRDKGITADHPPQIPVMIHITDLTLTNIHLDEHAGTLSGRLMVCWWYQDARVRWNPDNFGGKKTKVYMPRWYLWAPHFTVLNSVRQDEDGEYTGRYSYSTIAIDKENPANDYIGACPLQTVTVDCAIDASNYPVDEQFCTIVLHDKIFGRDFDYSMAGKTRFLKQNDLYENVTHANGWHVRSKLGMYASINATLDDLDFNDPKRITLLVALYTGSVFFITNKKVAVTVIMFCLMQLVLTMASVRRTLPTNYESQPAIMTYWQSEMALATVQFVICIVRLICRPNMRQIINPGILLIIDQINSSLPWIFLSITAFNLALLVYPETDSLKIEKEERTHHSDMTKLEKHIKNKGVNPLFPPQLPIKITIQTITLENVLLDEHAQTLSAYLMIQSSHQDKQLKWKTSEFDGLGELLISNWEVWTPKFVALNSIKILEDIDFTPPNYANGRLYTGDEYAIVSVFPVQHVTVDCKVRDDYFENITHFNGWHVKTKNFKFVFINSSLHEVSSDNPTRTMSNIIKIMVLLARDASYYFPIMIYPSMIMAAISGLAFLHTNIRLVMFMIFSNLLLLSMFMASVMSKLPTNYRSQPAILTFWEVEMMLSSVQLITCLIRMISNAHIKLVMDSGVKSATIKLNSTVPWMFLIVTIANVVQLLLPAIKNAFYDPI